MKETVPLPYPHVRGLAGAAALCPLLLPLPRSGPLVQGHLPQLAALPHGPALWAALASAHEARAWVCVCPGEQVHSLLAAVGLVAPLQALHLLRGGFAHLPRLPSARGFCLASGTAAHLTRERPERLLCSLFAILNIILCFSLICSVWDSCGGTCLGEEGPI